MKWHREVSGWMAVNKPTCATDDNKAHWIFPITPNKQCYSNTLLQRSMCYMLYGLIHVLQQCKRIGSPSQNPYTKHPDFSSVRLQSGLSHFLAPWPLWPWSLPLACLRAGCGPSLRWRSWIEELAKMLLSCPPWALPLISLFTMIRNNTVFARDALDLTALNSCILKEGLMNKPIVLHPAFSRSR